MNGLHQLFLGVTRALAKDFVNGWLRAHLKFASLCSYLDPMLLKVQSLSLDWCKAMPIGKTGSFGPHISENYLAHARLSRWLHSGLRLAEATDPEYADPADKTVGQYNKTESKKWLKARRLRFDKDSSLDLLRQRVQEAIDRNGGVVPPIFPPAYKAAPVEALESVVMSFLPMISQIMIYRVVTEKHPLDALRHIKIFLSTIELFETPGRENSATARVALAKVLIPVIIQKYNFITLLKIPNCMLRYGPLQVNWTVALANWEVEERRVDS
jgi:hypothetical protein